MAVARAPDPAGAGALVLVTLQPGLGTPLYRQIYLELRRAILGGRLPRGCRLPSTRSLAQDQRVSRATVVLAYEQLQAEGYVESVGRGATRVSSLLPDPLTRADAPERTSPSPPAGGPSARAAAIAEVSRRFPAVPDRPGPFRTGVPALDVFPVHIWERLTARRLRRSSTSSLAYADPRGLPALRAAIAAYLTAARGARCTPDEVLVTAGSQQAIDLVSRVLLDPGDPVWMEDPGYLGAMGAFVASGARIVPVGVDGEGLDVEAGIRLEPRARLAFVTPARQLPLGMTMSARRRLELVRWAAANRAWILEDDYDSEFRYTTRPLSCLQGLDPQGSIILTGTFSKVMFPAMRIGYVVVPPHLADAFSAARRLLDFCPPHLTQGTMADFMNEGHFERHIRRMRAIYDSRRTLLVHLLRRDLQGLLEVEAPDAGLNLIAWLPRDMDDLSVSRALAAEGIDVTPLSSFALKHRLRPGILLGFSGMREPELRRGVVRLRAALESFRQSD
jgi:GntR family transcriptional regulator/MocR family aminotransferase